MMVGISDSARNDAIQTEAQGKSGNDAEANTHARGSHHDFENMRAPRAQSNTNADFIGPLDDLVLNDTLHSGGSPEPWT
jgi:hypothetical protein